MDSQWLKTQFSLNPGKTKAGLARALGMEPPAVSKILKGSRQIKASEYAAMRRYFGLPVDGGSAVERVRNSSYIIQPLGENSGLQEHEPLADGADDWVIPAHILSQRTQAQPEQIRIFKMQENLMEPDFKLGENVLVDLSDCKPSPPGVFLISDGFGHLIRRCEIMVGSSSVPQVRISASAPGFTPQILKLSDFRIIGRVIAKLQWL